MRRTASPLSLILLGLGTFLLVLAPMLVWYVEPRAAVNPINIDTTAVYRGTGSYFGHEINLSYPIFNASGLSSRGNFRIPGKIDQFGGLGRVHRKWLLAQHVLAGQ